jgi:hypothetical protein
MRRTLLVVFVCSLLVAPVAAGTSTRESKPSPKTQTDARKYDLKYRPTVGQRIAYEQSLDMTVAIKAANDGARRSVDQNQKVHSQVVVTSEEILALRDGTVSSAKRVTFGPNCWSATQIDDKPTRKTRSVYAGKTVNFKLTADDKVEQDFGVKPSAQEMRMLRESMLGRSAGLPQQPVAIGDRWRNDDAMRALLDLSHDDTVSTLYALKGIKTHDGRQAAEIRVSAAILKSDKSGIHQELSFEGTTLVDLETGIMLKSDVTGTGSMSGTTGANVKINGMVTMEVHRAARLLPPADATADAK